MQITVTIPFGLGEAYITGDFIPYCPGKNYLSNGDPGYPDEPADFYIKKFEVEGVDIFDEIDRMLVTDSLTKKQVWYIDHITPKLIELAEEYYNEGIQLRMLGAED